MKFNILPLLLVFLSGLVALSSHAAVVIVSETNAADASRDYGLDHNLNELGSNTANFSASGSFSAGDAGDSFGFTVQAVTNWDDTLDTDSEFANFLSSTIAFDGLIANGLGAMGVDTTADGGDIASFLDRTNEALLFTFDLSGLSGVSLELQSIGYGDMGPGDRVDVVVFGGATISGSVFDSTTGALASPLTLADGDVLLIGHSGGAFRAEGVTVDMIAVPEPSVSSLLLIGTVSVLSVSRRRMRRC